MTRSKLLAGAAALALMVAAPSASFAFGHGGGGGGGGRVSGGGGAHFSGGGSMAGGRFAAAPSGGAFARGGVPGTRFAAAPTGSTFAGRPGWNGGFWRGGHFHHRHFFPGAVGAFAFYGGPDYDYAYGPDYYSDYYYEPEVAVVPQQPDASYCAQRYRSWDPATGTYLGYDGRRHPCP